MKLILSFCIIFLTACSTTSLTTYSLKSTIYLSSTQSALIQREILIEESSNEYSIDLSKLNLKNKKVSISKSSPRIKVSNYFTVDNQEISEILLYKKGSVDFENILNINKKWTVELTKLIGESLGNQDQQDSFQSQLNLEYDLLEFCREADIIVTFALKEHQLLINQCLKRISN